MKCSPIANTVTPRQHPQLYCPQVQGSRGGGRISGDLCKTRPGQVKAHLLVSWMDLLYVNWILGTSSINVSLNTLQLPLMHVSVGEVKLLVVTICLSILICRHESEGSYTFEKVFHATSKCTLTCMKLKQQYLVVVLPHIFTSRGRCVKQDRVIIHIRMFVCLFVCPFLKCVSGSLYTIENASNAALIPTSPEMKPGLAAVGSATVAVLSQSSGIYSSHFFP